MKKYIQIVICISLIIGAAYIAIYAGSNANLQGLGGLLAGFGMMGLIESIRGL